MRGRYKMRPCLFVLYSLMRQGAVEQPVVTARARHHERGAVELPLLVQQRENG